MSWKDWVYGDLVSAAEFQSLVQDQTVQRYADSTTRSSTLGSAVTEGMVSYLDDTNAVEVYRTSSAGSAWEEITPQAGRNAIINGAFDIWQRGTSFSATGFTADRWYHDRNGSGATYTTSQQTFTPGTAPVAGYEGQYYLRAAQTVAGSGATVSYMRQHIEDVRTFAGQTVTVSLWLKADSARTSDILLVQNFGSGGSTEVSTSVGTASITTSWQRFTFTVAVPSVAGKTIGASSFLNLRIPLPINTTYTIDIWGVQLEAGSTATSFKRNAPSIQAELAACQRYYWRASGSAASQNPLGNAFAISSTSAQCVIKYPVPMRTSPTVSTSAAADITFTWSAGTSATSAVNQDLYSTESSIIRITTSGLTVGAGGYYRVEASASKYIDFSAEL